MAEHQLATQMPVPFRSRTIPPQANGGTNRPYGNLTIDSESIYWTEANDSNPALLLYSCPLAGCAGEPALITSRNDFGSISADGKDVYWASPADTAIARCPVSGCGTMPETIALNQSSPGAIVTDGSNVYWIADIDMPNSRIMRAPKDLSTPPVVIAESQNQAAYIRKLKCCPACCLDLDLGDGERPIEVPIESGDIVLAYTDGLSDQTGAAQRRFDVRGEISDTNCRGESLPNVLDSVMARRERFRGAIRSTTI